MLKQLRLDDLLSRTANSDRSDAIGTILAATATPGVLSMAGGLPAPDSFPTAELTSAADDVLRGTPSAALQYAPVAGVPAMRTAMADWASRTGATVPADRVIVTSGSQQGLDLVTRVLLDPGDQVAIEDPSYLGAVQTFRRARAELLPIPGDEDGIDTEILADRLAGGARCKVVYVVPHFHNPTGAVLSLRRREHLAELAERYGFLVVEDDPYAELGFHGDRLPSIDSHTDRVVRLISLSKSVCPGFRVAGMVVPPGLVDATTTAKQCADLQTNTFGQYVLAELLARPGFLPGHFARLRTLYRQRSECLATLLTDRLPWLRFPTPRGGLFFWCAIRTAGVDATTLAETALRQGVAVVPGPPFCVARDGSHALRLSYATLSPDDLRTAVRRLASAYATLTEAS